jgi:hypothetical protein
MEKSLSNFFFDHIHSRQLSVEYKNRTLLLLLLSTRDFYFFLFFPLRLDGVVVTPSATLFLFLSIREHIVDRPSRIQIKEKPRSQFIIYQKSFEPFFF